MIAYKGRKIDRTIQVEVYRNLNARTPGERWSVKQSGLVVAHTDRITLCRPEFVVSASGATRVRAEGRKNVHARVKGVIAREATPSSGTWRVTYDPFADEAFLCRGRPIESADLAILDAHGCWARGPVFRGEALKKATK